MDGPRGGDCGASRWCGHFRQTSQSRMCCRSPFSRSRVHIVKQRFARWQGAESSDASSLRVPVWQGFGRLLWPIAITPLPLQTLKPGLRILEKKDKMPSLPQVEYVLQSRDGRRHGLRRNLFLPEM
jgi:hypothetical protein